MHLGSKFSDAFKLFLLLSKYEFEELYLVGDIIDGYVLQKKWYWDRDYNLLLKQFFLKTIKTKKVLYIIGNHDDFLLKYSGIKIHNMKIKRRHIVNRKNNRILLIHGDQIERDIHISRRAYRAGSYFYSWILYLDKLINKYLYKVDIAKNIKKNFKRVLSYVSKFEEKIADLALIYKCNSVVCGHIHVPEIKTINGINYYNCGDWVENHSMLVEHHCGKMELVN